jgi:DNA repair protein RadC
MAAIKHFGAIDRRAGASCFRFDRLTVAAVLATFTRGMADSGGDHSCREQLRAQSFAQGLWNKSGDLGVSAVRDNIRGYNHGSPETEVNLLATVLGSGVSEAKIYALLTRFGNTGTLCAADMSELTEILGNPADAAKLKTILHIAAEIAKPAQIAHPVIGNCVDLVHYLQTAMGGCRVETFRVLFLDTHNKIIADEVLWSGTVAEVQVYPREVMRRALELDSCAFIAAHNHPSNVVVPSKADINMTRQLLDAAGALGIAFHDHFIVSMNNYHSMRFHKSVDPWQ